MLANVAKSNAAPAMKNAITQIQRRPSTTETSMRRAIAFSTIAPWGPATVARHPALSLKARPKALLEGHQRVARRHLPIELGGPLKGVYSNKCPLTPPLVRCLLTAI